MAELIYKGMLKNCYAGDFRTDGKTPCTATYASIRKMIDIQPTITEAEIRVKAIDEFFDELQKYEDDDWLKLKMSSIYEIAEQLKGNEDGRICREDIEHNNKL